ncbi:hypothetical protein A9K97_gp267 [Tokyovirus A1]|uniref:hypothetical protein n=1 Tax=Tokyovirus A1 TaxID=1826170 RepID=UPI0007A9894F|nr:hypothetical protein A9K97_gp267 [Tokyovirus A1]BAU80084.1 hypothetical protein [Tokyovirus A1]
MFAFLEEKERVSLCFVFPENLCVSDETTEDACSTDTKGKNITRKRNFCFFLDGPKASYGPFCSVFEKWENLERATCYTRVKKTGMHIDGKKHGRVIVETFGPAEVQKGDCLDGGMKVFQEYEHGKFLRAEWGW